MLTTPDRRGAESSAVALDAALRARGVEGDVVALRGFRGPSRLDVTTLGGRSLSPVTLARLRRRARSVDVVVAHGSRTLPASALSLAGTGVPFVYKNIGDTAYWSASPLRKLRVRAALHRASVVVAMTADAKRSLHQHHRLSGPLVEIIPSWRSGQRFPPVTPERRTTARQELGLAPDDRVCLVMGALAPEKRFALAVEAVAGIAGAKLVVVGDGPDRRVIAAAAERLMPGRCTFTGIIDEPERVLPAADVVLLTSESEGVPGVLIEAGLTCLPSVAFDVGGVSSVVEHDRTGLLVPSGDVAGLRRAIEQVLLDGSGMGAQARERCLREFDTDRVVDRWLELLEAVATTTEGSPAATRP